ncbi:MAG TPA: iron-containing alcohol dehydrogenase [Alphaproteobacteria bacterium]|nr:iron-containing alcohol dehydrogenase [Alphaproteobacteria bacterium]
MTVISYLTTINFDHGAIATLADELKAVGIERPLIVTDKGIAAAGILGQVRATLPNSLPVAVYDETPTNPTESAVEDALEVYRAEGCDGLVALGGGSSMDLAKAVGVLATHDGPLVQYAAIEGGAGRITANVAPVIAVPTTSGTGSEVGRGSMITFADRRKMGLLSPHLIPKRAICDPDLTLGLPAGLTAATGMDAFTHGVETFLSPKINPPAEAIGLDGATRAWSWIERAVADGSNKEARWHMMMASMEGAMAFQKGLGAVHSMSHPLGGLEDVTLHHGTLNAVILPAVLRFNEGHVGDKYERLRAAFGLPADADLAQEVEKLNARLGLPANLREMGVTEEVLPAMVEGALADHSTPSNPRPAGAADFEALFEAAMG